MRVRVPRTATPCVRTCREFRTAITHGGEEERASSQLVAGKHTKIPRPPRSFNCDSACYQLPVGHCREGPCFELITVRIPCPAYRDASSRFTNRSRDDSMKKPCGTKAASAFPLRLQIEPAETSHTHLHAGSLVRCDGPISRCDCVPQALPDHRRSSITLQCQCPGNLGV